jgi:hypothetical protein
MNKNLSLTVPACFAIPQAHYAVMKGRAQTLEALSVTPELGIGLFLVGPQPYRQAGRIVMAGSIDNGFGKEGVVRSVKTMIEEMPHPHEGVKVVIFGSSVNSRESEWAKYAIEILTAKQKWRSFHSLHQIITERTPTLGVCARRGIVLEHEELKGYRKIGFVQSQQDAAEAFIISDRQGFTKQDIDSHLFFLSMGKDCSIEDIAGERRELSPIRMAFNLSWPRIDREMACIRF